MRASNYDNNAMQSAPTEINAVSQVSGHAKNLDIEVLRAVAVLATMLSHSSYLFVWGQSAIGWLGGHVALWAGVDLFFCISGFVIARGLVDQLASAVSGEERARVVCAFWIRRVHRIFPTAFLWLCIGLALTVLFNRYGAFGDLRTNALDAVASVAQMQDLHLYQCFGSGPNTCGTVPIFGPYWSLSLEEKFYLVLPLAIIFFGTRFKWFAALLIVAQVLMPRMTHDFLWWFRTDAFLLGALIALERGGIVHELLEPKFISRNFAARAVPLLMIAMVFAVASPLQVVPIFTGLLAIACAAVVWVASYGKGYIVGTGPLRTALAWVGSRSFAIYLVHVPAYCFTHELWARIEGGNVTFGGNYTVRFLLTAVVLIVAAAELNYRFVETPLRRRGAELSRKILRPLAPSASA
ncbi:acyltransferase family protein [Paraburkholderia caledonica]|uniref:Peptidoglycan/LPS O-acetylase OafA/YrhL n=1 Tax=Paraburkholderia caledonica TaxID=134536 RepID=A0AB73INX3_9BURK|nr:peptidoglycan/LPS O-acetylase OafA/YrhL [Paraburkholderia caledonica]